MEHFRLMVCLSYCLFASQQINKHLTNQYQTWHNYLSFLREGLYNYHCRWLIKATRLKKRSNIWTTITSFTFVLQRPSNAQNARNSLGHHCDLLNFKGHSRWKFRFKFPGFWNRNIQYSFHFTPDGKTLDKSSRKKWIFHSDYVHDDVTVWRHNGP